MIDKLSERVKQLATENAMLQVHIDALQTENNSLKEQLKEEGTTSGQVAKQERTKRQ